jgi:DNA-binding FrmR family transcriptional regulator
MTSNAKKNLEARLKRVNGQVEGIRRMVESERYCVDVLLQISAARAALAQVSKILLEAHIQTCVAGAFESDDAEQREAKIAELVRVFEKNCSC